MGALDGLLDQVKQAINDHASNPRGGDNARLFDKLADLFGNHPHNNTPLPASQDPYGDPADERGGSGGSRGKSIKPASEDPYGDPDDQR